MIEGGAELVDVYGVAGPVSVLVVVVPVSRSNLLSRYQTSESPITPSASAHYISP